MTKRKECVAIGQAQLFQQFNLQAYRDRHDLIIDCVEDITRITGTDDLYNYADEYGIHNETLREVLGHVDKVPWEAVAYSVHQQGGNIKLIQADAIDLLN